MKGFFHVGTSGQETSVDFCDPQFVSFNSRFFANGKVSGGQTLIPDMISGNTKRLPTIGETSSSKLPFFGLQDLVVQKVAASFWRMGDEALRKGLNDAADAIALAEIGKKANMTLSEVQMNLLTAQYEQLEKSDIEEHVEFMKVYNKSNFAQLTGIRK